MRPFLFCMFALIFFECICCSKHPIEGYWQRKGRSEYVWHIQDKELEYINGKPCACDYDESNVWIKCEEMGLVFKYELTDENTLVLKDDNGEIFHYLRIGKEEFENATRINIIEELQNLE